MFARTSIIVESTATLLSLSRTAWKLGLSLSKLSQHVEFLDTIVSDLAAEAKALSVACDFLYCRLKELAEGSTVMPTGFRGCDTEIWDCLTSQLSIIGDITVELDHFVKSNARLDSPDVQRLQYLTRPGTQRNVILALQTKISRHSDDLTMTLLLINLVSNAADRHRDPRQKSDQLKRLRTMTTKLETAITDNPKSRISCIETRLIGCAHESIKQVSSKQGDVAGTTSMEKGQKEQGSSSKSGNWLNVLETLQMDRLQLANSTTPTLTTPRVSMYGKHTMMTSPRISTATKTDVGVREDIQLEDDFDAELAKAALDTGIEAFNAQEWKEADSLIQEAVRALLQLSQKQRAFCDLFSLHYRLAVCSYYTCESQDAEQGLRSLTLAMPGTDVQRLYIYHAMHLLSQLCIRTGQTNRARLECEKALQGRRRISGKQSQEAMESIALMAHIYVLLDNRARAKSCLAMIPVAQRDHVLETVEASLGGVVEHLDYASLLTQVSFDDSVSVASRGRRRLSLVSNESRATSGAASVKLLASPLGMRRQDSSHEPTDTIGASSTLSHRQSATRTTSPKIPQPSLVQRAMMEEDPPVWGTPVASADDEKKTQDTKPVIISPVDTHPTVHKGTLSREEILQRIGCQPRDKIEEAVCVGDLVTLTALLKKRKTSWRSSVRKHGRSERVTALHFAALFGELQIARLLIDAKFDVNEVPFGYSSSLTPLHFAIGAHQVDIVALLLLKGASPCEGECWTTLAKQLLSRAWLVKTTSEADRGDISTRILAIFTLLLKYGWDVNEPLGPNHDTMLHQAVGFWTGSYKWDLDVRIAVTEFLCGRGADPKMKNVEGKSPLDVAFASGQRDLIGILEGSASRKILKGPCSTAVELPGHVYDGDI
ncbi:hypothetical protein T440DRAFT_481142 [Plenodomus tracheiphilus IPT5]|uniref:Uncharacterized protein n=1 Tax=Plenodomus tracheiphilus IPT5 TaxID=1408161 RepID=A0A6A7AXQ7_9PLEO|nr:hypothetical protein T440DRAFT_481142 [Plenodomus tracheiphilus IPT5]